MVWKRIIRGPQGNRSKTGKVWKGNETSPVRNIGTSAGREWENTRETAEIDPSTTTTTTGTTTTTRTTTTTTRTTTTTTGG